MKTFAILCSLLVAACCVKAYVPSKLEYLGPVQIEDRCLRLLLLDFLVRVSHPASVSPLLLDHRDWIQASKARSGLAKGGCGRVRSLHHRWFGHDGGTPTGRCLPAGSLLQQYDGGGEGGP